ncbi:MAG: hypothetical protein D6693_08360 [Planctomycetota bacterium]|nr:MAG: hypothetical protein D6693_08360 [Planctomycetota bacterium]
MTGRPIRALVWVAALAVSAPAIGQVLREDPRQAQAPIAEAPPLADSVSRLLGAGHLREDEKRALRVFHGAWSAEDLASPALRARAALIVGAWDDPVFSDEAVPAEDRAEAMLRRGDLERAIEALAGATSVRSRRIRAQALEGLGRFEEADAAIEPVAALLRRARADRAEDLVEGVRALAIRARLRGEPAQNHQTFLALVARARDEIDRLYWPAHVAEAELLYDKDNSAQAREALVRALALNPRCADAWRLLGRMAVDGFNMDGVDSIAGRLDALLGTLPDAVGAGSAIASSLRARARLRRNDPDGALEALAPTLARMPKQRELRALEAAAHAVRYDFAQADARLAALDEVSPGAALGYFEVGRALAEARQYQRAAAYLEEASSRRPDWPPPLVELGLLELQAGRDSRALAALRRVAELDPYQVRARNSLELIEELLTYDTVESEHFVVRFKPGVDRVMAEEMLGPLEDNHRIVAGAIEHEPARKTRIELMPDHRWFAVRITGMPAIHTIAASTGPVIAMEAPKVGPNHTGEYDWVRVIRHEYVHTVTLSRTKNRIPHWFTEAAAVYLERAPRDYDTVRLLVDALTNDALFDMEEINIAFVRPKKPTDRAQAYAQGHWMYEYIVERWGASAPLRLMDLYAEGVREEAAFRQVLGVTRDEFSRDFAVWARAQAASWGMLPEPTVRALLVEQTLADEAGRDRVRSALGRFALDAALALAGAGRAGAFEPPLVEPTEAMVDGWLERLGDHPGALQLKIGLALQRTGGEPTMDLAPTLERYAAARPVDPAPHRLLARLWLASEDPADRLRAVEHLEYLDAREQQAPVYASALARLLADAGRLDEAATRAERATTIAPFDPALRELAARVALAQRDLPRARRHIAALTRLEPGREVHRRRLERIDDLIARGG